MYPLIMVIHVFIAVSLIGLVLVQQGKGATVGAAFGSGASQTVFGSRGTGSFLLKLTIGFAAIFFATSIALNYMATEASKHQKQIVLPAPLQNKTAVLPPVSPGSIPLSTPFDPIPLPMKKSP